MTDSLRTVRFDDHGKSLKRTDVDSARDTSDAKRTRLTFKQTLENGRILKTLLTEMS